MLMASSWSAHAVEIDGFTEPYRDIDVAATEMGRLVRLQVSEGDRVAVGQIVARLNDEVINATLDIAKAGMESSGRLEAAQAELRMHEETLVKLRELLERSHATRREVDRALAQKDMAAARVKTIVEELRVKTLEFQRTQTQLEQRRVLSPIEGIVTMRYKDEGEFVSPNDPIVVRVVQLDPLLVVFSVPLAEARKLDTEEPVQVQIEAGRKTVEGVVEFLSPTADAQSGTTHVRVRIPNPNEAIPSGVTCRLVLPDAAITNPSP
jgi:RND family efflux transporter MFP subunit